MQRRGDDAILHRCGRSALMDAAVGADTGRFFSAPLVILFHFLASSSTWCLQLAATPTVHLLIRSECCPIGAFLAVASLSLSLSLSLFPILFIAPFRIPIVVTWTVPMNNAGMYQSPSVSRCHQPALRAESNVSMMASMGIGAGSTDVFDSKHLVGF